MDCNSTIVAQNEGGMVSICSCGTVNVNYGNATIRIPLSEYMAFAGLIDESFTHLAAYELRLGESG